MVATRGSIPVYNEASLNAYNPYRPNGRSVPPVARTEPNGKDSRILRATQKKHVERAVT